VRCPQCDRQNREQARFCDGCGAALPLRCHACSAVNRPGAKYCDGCGAALIGVPSISADARSISRPNADQSPSPYTPRYLSENILATRSALEGERKLVTVLFADIADSSMFAQQLDAERLHSLLDKVLQLAADAVHRYGGTVNSYLGDGLMALFGAPTALEDHAVFAAHAALTIQETIRGYNTQFKREHGVEVRLRIGLNTGSVVVGRIGDNLRMDYTANSNTVHLASRMQSLAEAGSILITEAMQRAVGQQIQTELVGPVDVRGQRERVTVYKITGRGRRRNRWEIRAEQGLTTLVGRQRELALLHEHLTRAEAGRGQAIAIAGEAGLGKSRLLHEFHQSLADNGVDWLDGQCLADGRTVPYGPILEILRLDFHIEEGDNPLQIREKLRAGVVGLDPSLDETIPFLELLFDLPGADEMLRHLDPKDRRHQMLQAIVQVISAAGRRRPLALVIEDLHWRDQSSEDFLAFLVGGLPSMPVLLLTTHRPGYTVRWADMPFFTQISLDRLADEEMEQMTMTLLGGDNVSGNLLRFIADKSEGNPLFIEEVARALIERDFVIREPSRLMLAGDAEVELPATIQGIIQARVDALKEPVKQTVQIAAVIGRDFDVELVQAASGSPDEVPGQLETLKHLELIHEIRPLPNIQYRFKHAFIQGVVYKSLLGPRRKALHGRIAQSMESLGLQEQAGALAYHYSESDEQETAVKYLMLAGDQAARLFTPGLTDQMARVSANAEAFTYYDRALSLAKVLPGSPEMQYAQIDASLKRASVSTTREAQEQDQNNLAEARTLAEALGDEARLASVSYWLGRLAYVQGRFDAAINFAEQGLAIADRLNDEGLAAPPVNLMGRSCYLTGQYGPASHLLARSVEQMHALGNITEEASAAGFAGVALGALGDFERALAYADRGIRLAQELGKPFVEAAAYNYRAVVYCHQGSRAAIADCEMVRRIAERIGDRFRVYLAQFYEGQAYITANEPQRARELLEKSIGLADQLGTTTLLAWGQALLATALLELGEAAGALPLCNQAIELAQRTRDPFANALAHRTLAEATAILAPLNIRSAEDAVLEAMRIQQELGAEPELARSRFAYARLLNAWHRTEEARPHLMQALETFRRLDMSQDLRRAEEALHLCPRDDP
jgi:class 3 adenylate cyclase/tetratricopeptide (TPR) repeat protein